MTTPFDDSTHPAEEPQTKSDRNLASFDEAFADILPLLEEREDDEVVADAPVSDALTLSCTKREVYLTLQLSQAHEHLVALLPEIVSAFGKVTTAFLCAQSDVNDDEDDIVFDDEDEEYVSLFDDDDDEGDDDLDDESDDDLDDDDDDDDLDDDDDDDDDDLDDDDLDDDDDLSA
jgi:hypothetical protein